VDTRIIAIDWSGAVQGARRKIWLAEATPDGRLIRLEDGRSRDEIAQLLIEESRRTPRMVVGLDFAFSLPAWYLEQLGLTSAADLWALADREADTWLAACKPPFWGRPGTHRPELAAHFRKTELDAPSTAGIRPKSVFQVGGAGAVGSGSLRGMRLLHQLHGAGFSIWPFDPPGWPRVVEIYPRLLTGPVHKSNTLGRADYLTAHFAGLDERLLPFAMASEDAFDAAVSALVMARHAEELAALPSAADRQTELEGVIWHPTIGTGTHIPAS
jgi:hypothetical protein